MTDNAVARGGISSARLGKRCAGNDLRGSLQPWPPSLRRVSFSLSSVNAFDASIITPRFCAVKRKFIAPAPQREPAALGFALKGDCTPPRALACGRRSHTCGARRVFCEVHAPAKNDPMAFAAAAAKEFTLFKPLDKLLFTLRASPRGRSRRTFWPARARR